MVIYLYGADSKRSREHLGKMVDKFVRERDPERLNNKILTIGAVDDSVVRAELMSAPFLADRRLVVLEHLLACGGEELVDWFTKRFVERTGPEDLVVVVWEEASVKKPVAGAISTQLHTALKETKYAQEFPVLEGKKREQWIIKNVIEQGGQITLEAAAAIARRVSDDFSAANYVQMLVAYTNGRVIVPADLEVFLPPDIENTIFAAMDALSIKNRAAAVNLLSNVWVVDNDPVYIFAMLHRQVRLLLQARELLDDNPSVSETTVAKKMAVHPFVARKLLQQSGRWSRTDLVRWYDALLQVDYSIKHGTQDPHILIDRIMAV